MTSKNAKKCQRDVKSYYEKNAHKGLDYGSLRRFFMVSGCPEGT